MKGGALCLWWFEIGSDGSNVAVFSHRCFSISHLANFYFYSILFWLLGLFLTSLACKYSSACWRETKPSRALHSSSVIFSEIKRQNWPVNPHSPQVFLRQLHHWVRKWFCQILNPKFCYNFVTNLHKTIPRRWNSYQEEALYRTEEIQESNIVVLKHGMNWNVMN